MRGSLVALVLVALALPSPRASAGERAPGVDFVDPTVLVLDGVETVRPHPTKLTLSAHLLGRHTAPQVAVIRPDGRAEYLDQSRLRFQDPAFEADLAFGHGRGVYRVEVLATAPGRLTHSGARLRFFVGVSADTPDEPEPPDEPAEAGLPEVFLEARFFARVNEHRRRARLDPFEWLEPLGVVARAHARACVKVGRLDHRVNNDGNLVDRVVETFAWTRPQYASPPERPSRGPDAVDYVTAALDAQKSLDRILYRWQRFAAFCVPMTSEGVTHAACGIARAPGGLLYVVFAYSQLNRESTLRQVEAERAGVLRRWKHAEGATARAGALLELGRWRGRPALDAARRAAKDPEAGVRAAALDVQLLLDEEKTRRDVDALLETHARNVARRTRTSDALGDLDALRRLGGWPDAVVRARELRAVIEAQAEEAWGAAKALQASGDAPAFLQALRVLSRDYPGTQAAVRAAEAVASGG